MYTERKNEPVLKLKNDFLFKAVYGSDTEESKFILICLLNKILDRKDDPIVSIEYKNPFQMKAYMDEKETVLDIKASTSHNELIDIEMQIVWEKEMPSRLLYYHGGLIRESLQEGDSYDNMKETITICITDSIAFPQTKDFISRFYMIEENNHFKFSERTLICCIELPKVNTAKKPPDELSPLEICLEYLRYADENGSEYIEELIRRGGKDLEMAQVILKKATEDEILREQALAREKFQRDMIYWKSRYGVGVEDGFKDGMEQGLKDGFKDGREKGLKDGFKDGREQGLKDGFKDGREQGLKDGFKDGREQGLKDGFKDGREQGHIEGLKDGREQGIIEGSRKRNLEIALNLKSAGIEIEKIAEATGLSIDEIKGL